MEQYDIFPAQLLAESIRDSGYKTTAHAIAELIDNSVQAQASLVEVFCIEDWELVQQRHRHRVVEIAVLDDGTGMDRETLRIALMFGNGRYLGDRSGIGRFGMGLPNSSLSQSQRVEVWSWQSGPDNALHSYLDYREIKRGDMREVPVPEHQPVPDIWREVAQYTLGESGTLVVWSDLDRVNWTRARSTLKHTELLVGRMYRKMIYEDGLRIRLAAVREGEADWDMDVRVNDPLFLMAPSSTPEPFNDRPMFRPWGEGEERISVELEDGDHMITIRSSWAREETMSPETGHPDPGHHDYGKHALRNRGISVIRARRELDLDTSWNRGDIYRDRWWGIEVEFPPALDEIFGVTNNKQAATHFAELAEFFADEERQEEWQEFREVWKEEGDPRFYLMDVAQHIADQRNQMRTRLKQLRHGARQRQKESRHTPTIEDRASEKIRERQKEAEAEVVDEPTTADANYETVFKELTTTGGMAERDAGEIAEAVKTRNRLIIFVETDQDSNAFFSPKALPGIHEVRLNLNHPVHKLLIESLDSEVEENVGELRVRLQKASDTLKLLLCAWSRFELEARERRRLQIEEHRREWGKMARIFLDEDLEE